MMSSSVNSLIFNFLEIRLNTITEGWLTRRQINHMDMVDLLQQIMIASGMDNSIKDNGMDILDLLHIMVTILIKNIQMVI